MSPAQVNAVQNRPHHVHRKSALLESRREREFYRYYEPIQALTEYGPSLCDLDNEAAIKAHRATSSPDRALTAFCQLGALRLGCRRAMLFFFDSSYAYILAEATRTLSLQNDSVHTPEDELWLGHTVIPRGHTICEETVCRLPPDDASDPDAGICLSHVIADLDKDTTFCGKPYVTGGPKAKFYAGVPITTPKGINIGAYCCLDDHKREGLDAKGVEFLQDMAKTVMTHLDFVRAKAEHERGTRMVSGLGAFIEGASSMQSWKKETERRDYRRVGVTTTHEPAQRQSLKSSDLPTPFTPDPQRPSVSPLPPDASEKAASTAASIRPAAPTSSSSVTTTGPETGSATPASTPSEPHNAEPRSRMSRQSTENMRELHDHLLPPNVRNTFKRAADLLREAVDVDGVAFLDSSPHTYGGLVDVHDGSDQSSDAQISAAEQTATGTEGEGRTHPTGSRDKACKVLASSHTSEDRYNHRGELQRDIQATTITERFLTSLLKRHPFGKIWNFSEEGAASSDDSASDSNARHDQYPSSKLLNGDAPNDSAARRTARRRRSRVDDGREIQRLFPGVRSLALCGMWDQNRGRWYSACAIWTYSPLRLFSQDLELNYMSAYCDVVMAELYRLEAQNSDRAKSDFISSISHELRSPLHGILGSVECLQEESSADSYNSDLVSQIEVCGRTLIDIVEHLLDYSKINHQVKQPSGQAKKRSSLDETKKTQLGGLLSTEISQLDDVTEEVVETACYSFCCAKPKEYVLDRKVAVILDIDRNAATNWQCKIPLGAWKRICINLVSNAMKYTSEGFVHISLKAQPIPGKQKRFNAVFTVQDSGRGMSQAFMSDHLFRAFSQEDNLAEGTGLGMSLVAKIVKAMNGRIDVASEKGVGTTMSVTIPLDVARASKGPLALGSAVSDVNSGTVAILGFRDLRADGPMQHPDSHTIARTKQLHSMQHKCEQLGFRTRRPNGEFDPDADVYLIAEQDLSTYAQRKLLAADSAAASGLDKPLIVLCNSAVSARQLRATSAVTGFTTQRVEYIAQPCGTERLGKAIRTCVQEMPSFHESDSHATQGAVEGKALLSTRVPLRSRVSSRNVDSPDLTRFAPAVRPPATPTNGVGNTSTDRLPMPPDDYLSNRSRSTGGKPLSPQVLDAVPPPKKPSIRHTTKDVPPSGMSLLLVDDNQINLQLLVNYATKQGHRKTTATDGAQAVEAYKAACLASGNGGSGAPFHATGGPFAGKHSIDTSLEQSDKPQVILMDISMPVMNGFEATRLIRAFEQQYGVKPARIIALTGLGSASAQQEAFSSGVDLYLTKPVRLKELTKLLADIRSSVLGRADTPVAK